MGDDVFPILALPNDSNDSDISILLTSGKVITASEAFKAFPVIKTLTLRHIKLMADDTEATPSSPQVKVVPLEKYNYASVSFYCSKDNYGRRTSASIVFREGQEAKINDLLLNDKTPDIVKGKRDELVSFVSKFKFRDYTPVDNDHGSVKKKTFFIIAFAVLGIAIFVLFSKYQGNASKETGAGKGQSEKIRSNNN